MAVPAEVSLLDCEMSLKTAYLEKAYERALADSAHLIDEERDRVRRMEYLLLQIENDKLRSELDTANMQVVSFKHGESDTLGQLTEAYREIDSLNHKVQFSSSEIERLQNELSAMNNTSASYQSLLSEKMHLTRDLSNLKAELERIKSQSHSQQSSIMAKQEMERQLNSLEVQLEDETHAHERTKSRSLQQSAEITSLAAKAEELQGELLRQSRAKQQHEREIQQQSTEWENQRAVLEGKIETLRKQLRSTKDKLQEAQQDLQQRRSHGRSQDKNTSEPQSKMIPLQRPGPSAGYQSGMTIVTPGAVRVQGEAKKQSALPGDKSAFSITPFLNRTGAQMDSPASSEISNLDDEELNQVMTDSLSPLKSRALQDSAAAAAAAAASHSSEDQSTAKRGPAKGTKGKSKTQEGKLTFPEVTNEAKKVVNRSNARAPLKDANELAGHPLDPTQAKPRKRKLGAQRDRNIFEDEEEEPVETRKQGRKLGLGGGASASDRAPKALGFGGFSPLKRDRRQF